MGSWLQIESSIHTFGNQIYYLIQHQGRRKNKRTAILMRSTIWMAANRLWWLQPPNLWANWIGTTRHTLICFERTYKYPIVNADEMMIAIPVEYERAERARTIDNLLDCESVNSKSNRIIRFTIVSEEKKSGIPTMMRNAMPNNLPKR